MREKLIAFIEQLKTNTKILSYNEAETKLAIIQPLIGYLGWDRDNPDEVKPEYSVENRRVDFSLRLNNSNAVFIEVKQTGEDLDKKEYQEQLLDYSFRQGVKLAILTNGITWCFYLPMKDVDWEKRKFYTIDIKEQESHEVTAKFIDFLLKDNVLYSRALKHAESVYEGKRREEAIEETLPKAWNKIVSDPDDLLIELLAETTEKICGFKDIDIVKRFLANYKDNFSLTIEDVSIREIKPPLVHTKKSSLNRSSYRDAYRKQLNDPDNLISRIREYIKEKRVVSYKDLKRVCVQKFGCKSETSGSIGACVTVLEDENYIRVEGKDDSKRLLFIK
ncbi:MAG: hypothetical protein A2Y97_02160 [Nitrospirae bacterium RBG_13_39_12]|nr:MAG: hypothetical protein A2Y97_02160 [Nitrospirae bacterium RBG_13_39_12]